MEIPSHDELDAFRRVGDPVADDTFACLVETGLLSDPLTGVERLARDGVRPAETLWDQVHTTPAWVDYEEMQPSFDVALQNVITGGLALMAGSLVESYASSNGAKVLVRTGRLEKDTRRRLYETAQFAADIALCRGVRPGNRAWHNVVAVRLMHARVRWAMNRRGDWNEEWGDPVNQEDYAATLFMFSLVYRRSLSRLGVRVDDEFRRANHHVWRHVGWLMGVDDRLLTRSPADEVALYRRVTSRQFHPDEDSRRLAHGLLRAMAVQPPFFLPQGSLYGLSRRLVGDELADSLGFPPSGIWERAWSGARGLNAVSSRAATLSRPLSRASVRFGEALSRGIVASVLPGGADYV